MSLWGWVQAALERDRQHRDRIRQGARLRTSHARALRAIAESSRLPAVEDCADRHGDACEGDCRD